MIRATAVGLVLYIAARPGAAVAQEAPMRPPPLEPQVDDAEPVEVLTVAPEIPIPRNGAVLLLANVDGWSEDVLPSVQVSTTEAR